MALTHPQRDLDKALAAHGRVKIVCATCGETVGHYRPGRVLAPSIERPLLWLKCTRRGCRTATLAVLDEAND